MACFCASFFQGRQWASGESTNKRLTAANKRSGKIQDAGILLFTGLAGQWSVDIPQRSAGLADRVRLSGCRIVEVWRAGELQGRTRAGNAAGEHLRAGCCESADRLVLAKLAGSSRTRAGLVGVRLFAWMLDLAGFLSTPMQLRPAPRCRCSVAAVVVFPAAAPLLARELRPAQRISAGPSGRLGERSVCAHSGQRELAANH